MLSIEHLSYITISSLSQTSDDRPIMKICLVLCKLAVIEGVFHPAMHNHTLGKLYNLYFGETRCHQPAMHLITFSKKSTNLSLAPGSEEINPGKPKLGEPPSIIMNKSLIPSKSKAR